MNARAEFEPIDGVECITCGDVTPTFEGRCPKCGNKLPQLQGQTAASVKPATAEKKSERPIELPSTPKTRMWLKLTRELSEELVQEAERLEARARKHQAQARDAKTAVNLLKQIQSLVAPIPISDETK